MRVFYDGKGKNGNGNLPRWEVVKDLALRIRPL
jgi:hypothetical protein